MHSACAQLCMTLAAPWTVARQAPLSVEFSKNTEVDPIPLSRTPSNPGIKSISLASPAMAGEFFTTKPAGKPNTKHNLVNLGYLSMRGDYFYIVKCAHSKGNPVRHLEGRGRTNCPACHYFRPTLT